MSDFICPVCKSYLFKNGGVYRCTNNHSFDVSKYGYVNLLMSQQSSKKRHGDDTVMVAARREFLQKGYYKPLQEALCSCVRANVKSGLIADIGCGEGYYSSAVAGSPGVRLCGIDISKDALRYAARAIKSSEFAVASAFELPFGAESVDSILSVFAPSAYPEFHRVLTADGLLIKAVPLQEHLWGLKCALYKKPYLNKPEIRNDDLFKLISFQEIKYEITLRNSEDIQNLFKMTPYYYKTGRSEAGALAQLKELNTVVHFGVEVYRKR